MFIAANFKAAEDMKKNICTLMLLTMFIAANFKAAEDMKKNICTLQRCKRCY